MTPGSVSPRPASPIAPPPDPLPFALATGISTFHIPPSQERFATPHSQQSAAQLIPHSFITPFRVQVHPYSPCLSFLLLLRPLHRLEQARHRPQPELGSLRGLRPLRSGERLAFLDGPRLLATFKGLPLLLLSITPMTAHRMTPPSRCLIHPSSCALSCCSATGIPS